MNRSATAVCFFTVLIPTLASTQVTSASSSYASGDQTTISIANGDFNGDGVLDLVTVNSGTLSFYRGLGGGKFANPVDRPVPKGLGQVAAADFNHDGKLDLAIGAGRCSSTGVVTILLGNGNGTFTHGANVNVGGAPQFIALADFNGDHIPDIAVSVCKFTSGVATVFTKIFLGQGDGTFKLSAALSFAGGQIVAGDFNADGHQDIAVLTSSKLVMYLGKGNGTFQSPILASTNTPFSVAVGDFYNNRIQSLALLTGVYNPDQSNFIYYASTARYQNGSIMVSSPHLVSPPDGGTFWERIAAGDLNGDFKDDIIVVAARKFGAGALTDYMLGNGNGTFQPAMSLPAYGESEDFPFIRDLNLDSRHDIGTSWSNGYIVSGGGSLVLLNTNAITNCDPPKAHALGVHVCAPYNGETLGTRITFKAAGNAFNGIAKRMELWIDGKKIGQNLEDQLRVTALFPIGKHTASFVAVDSFDHHVTKSVTFNVR